MACCARGDYFGSNDRGQSPVDADSDLVADARGRFVCDLVEKEIIAGTANMALRRQATPMAGVISLGSAPGLVGWAVPAAAQFAQLR